MSTFFSKIKSAFSNSPESEIHSQEEEMQQAIPVQTSLNTEWIENFFAGDNFLAAGAMEMFLDETLPEFEKMQTVLEKNGIQSLQKLLHRLKPSFKIIGLDDMADALAEIERDCITINDKNEVSKRIKILTTALHRLLPLVNDQYLNISKLADL